VEGLKLSIVQDALKSNYAYFPLVIEEEKTGVTREMVMEKLKENNIFVRKYFYPLCSDFEVIKDMGIVSDVPVATYISDRVITLPDYSDLKPEEVDEICDIILSLYQ
jgi:dTDP-4-amino-4,6-dideoxygalactose transaminase